MRFRSLFPWFRRPSADPTPTPDVGSPLWYAYTPEARARDAHMQARRILEHLMRGHTASRRQMMRAEEQAAPEPEDEERGGCLGAFVVVAALLTVGLLLASFGVAALAVVR